MGHKLFGTGVVLSAQPMGNDTLLEIAFEKQAPKADGQFCSIDQGVSLSEIAKVIRARRRFYKIFYGNIAAVCKEDASAVISFTVFIDNSNKIM